MSPQVENEARASIPAKQGTSPEQTSALEESIFKLSGQLSTITRNQKYFRTRENRNFSTVRSTERRIFNFSVIESLMMVCMAGLQVFIVRFFFQVCEDLFKVGNFGRFPMGREYGRSWSNEEKC
jgi:ubiquitin carboxyl-terminal hydrolase 7